MKASGARRLLMLNVYTHLGDDEKTLPLHLRRLRDTRFWFELLPEHKTLYLQFNSVNNSREETLEQFTKRLWDFYEEHSGEIEKFVLDLRYNPGGNGYLLRPFIHGFIRHDEVNRRGRLYRETRAGDPSAYDEGAINRLGYSFLGEGKARDAIEIFKLNTKAHPESWNVWDSLTEAYMESGEVEQAIRHYEKSLELNPQMKTGGRC